MGKLFTSESVTEGHPDKICDQISDAILDEALRQDSNSRVACETFVTTGLCSIMGEITTDGYIDFQGIAREVIKDIGYTSSEYGFDYKSCGVISAVDSQSADIALGTNDEVGGAGDQGIMFGFACTETPELMPLPISLANKLAMRLTEVRKSDIISGLRPDGKTQVTVEYGDNGVPVRVDTIVISTQHDEDVDVDTLADMVWNEVVERVVPAEYLIDTKFLFNPTGKFVIGGPHGDTGLTGRKIIVDTYGGYARHGGGAFSGKDPTKVDRSACYMARYVAKNIVAAGLAKKCEIQFGYAIGVAEPVSVSVDTFGTSHPYSERQIEEAVKKVFDLTPKGIINTLDLRKPIYRKTSAYGHFGREIFTWERTDKTLELLEAIKG